MCKVTQEETPPLHFDVGAAGGVVKNTPLAKAHIKNTSKAAKSCATNSKVKSALNEAKIRRLNIFKARREQLQKTKPEFCSECLTEGRRVIAEARQWQKQQQEQQKATPTSSKPKKTRQQSVASDEQR